MTITVDTLIQWFEASEDATISARQKSERDRDYVDGIQWTADEVKTLNKRKEPVITINRIKRQVNYLKGVEAQSRTDPKALPRTPVHGEAAEAATDAIRFVLDNNGYDRIRSKSTEEMWVEGIGAVEVTVKAKGDEFECVVRRFAWDRFFYDPHSSEDDFKDARYMGGVIWMDLDRARERFKGKESEITASVDSSKTDTYDDRPGPTWSDSRRQRVRVVHIYYIDDGVWHTAIITKGGALVDPIAVPFMDEDGNPENPLIAQSLYVNRDNERYGVVRDMVSPQDEVNKRRSKALHLLNVRQSRIGGSIADKQRQIRTELAKPDGVIVAEPDEFNILPTTDMAEGNLMLLREAKGELDLMGVNAPLQGKQTHALSGKAVLASQQGGMVEITPLLDARRNLDLRVYRAVWNRIRQYWTAPKWIRVTDTEENLKFVGLNQQVTIGEKLAEGTPDQQAAIMREMGIGPDDPRLNGVAEERNMVSEMDVDIIMEETPDIPTIQQEQFSEIAALAAGGVPIPPDLLIEASSLRNKKALLEKMRGGGEDPEAAQAAAEKVAQVEAMQLDEMKAKIEKIRSETLENIAQAAKAKSQATAPK